MLRTDNIPLVSICIPTYNRSSYLEKALLAYVKMQEFIDGKVEIVISDNASSDDTKECVKFFTNKYSNITYYRNEKNIKDENFPLVMSLGNGVLHKLVHDNFIVSKCGMSTICAAAKIYRDKKPVLFFDNGKSENINALDKAFYEVEPFLLGLGYWITWSGGVALWHDDCVNLAAQRKWCDLHLWQVGMLCKLMKEKHYGVVIHKNWGGICEVQNKDVSYGIVKVFHDNYLYILNNFYSEGILSKRCINSLEKDMLYGYFTKCIFYMDCNLDGNIIYGNCQCLKESVYKVYKEKEYFSHYLRYYKRFYLIAYFVRFINIFINARKVREFIKNNLAVKNIFNKIKWNRG